MVRRRVRRGTLLAVGGGLALVSILAVSASLSHSEGRNELVPGPGEEWLVGKERAKAILAENRLEVERQQAAERAMAIADLPPLPPGASYRDPALPEIDDLEREVSADTRDEVEPLSAQFEAGYFATLVAHDWQCAWLGEAAQAHEAGNLGRVQVAVSRLESFRETSYYEYFVDYDRVLSDFVYPIPQGNTGPANDYLAANCSPVTQPGG